MVVKDVGQSEKSVNEVGRHLIDVGRHLGDVDQKLTGKRCRSEKDVDRIRRCRSLREFEEMSFESNEIMVK